MRTREKDRPANWNANAAYRFTWYNTQTGKWLEAISLKADAQGNLQLPFFPGGQETTDIDWAAKITAAK
jgi:hypothetical protein